MYPSQLHIGKDYVPARGNGENDPIEPWVAGPHATYGEETFTND